MKKQGKRRRLRWGRLNSRKTSLRKCLKRQALKNCNYMLFKLRKWTRMRAIVRNLRSSLKMPERLLRKLREKNKRVHNQNRRRRRIHRFKSENNKYLS